MVQSADNVGKSKIRDVREGGGADCFPGAAENLEPLLHEV